MNQRPQELHLDPPGSLARRPHDEQRAHRVTASPASLRRDPPSGRYAHHTTNTHRFMVVINRIHQLPCLRTANAARV